MIFFFFTVYGARIERIDLREKMFERKSFHTEKKRDFISQK